MNKKTLILIGIIILIIAGVSTYFLLNKNSKKDSQISNQEQVENKKESEKDNMGSNGKTAVVYFSATGTTEEVAKKIANVTDSDIIEIIPEVKYTSSDLNYSNDNSRANKEQNSNSARPKIANDIDIDKYDIIFLGYPIWWGDIPKIILTFIDNNNLNGKTIIPFCTSGSTGISQSQSTLESYNKNIKWLKGKRFSSNVSEKELTEWIKKLNL